DLRGRYMNRDRNAQVRRLGGLGWASWFVLCALVVPTGSLGEITFEKTYGGIADDWGLSVQQTSDGGYIVAGFTESFGAGSEDAYLVKTDSFGVVLWSRTYGGTNADRANCVQRTRDGGYILVGFTDSYGPGKRDVYLLKTDALGETLWVRTYGGGGNDDGKCVRQTSDGGYIIAGWTTSFGAGGIDFYLIKTDPLGNAYWTKTYGGTSFDKAFSVRQTLDGGYIVTGWTNSYGAGRDDIYLVKTDSLGNAVWIRTYGSPYMDAGHSVLQMTDGGYLVAGYTCPSGQGNADIYLVRTDSSGNTLWSTTYGGLSEDCGWFVQQTPDGGFVIAGQTGRQLCLIKTTALGDTSWTRKYGGNSWEVGQSVQHTSDGGYIVAGVTHSFGAGGLDVYLIKTESFVDTTCKPREPPQMRSQGYWRRQCKDDFHEDICVYLDSVQTLAGLFDGFDCDSVCDLMRVVPPERDMCLKAKRQFMTLLLNIASGKLAVCNCLEDGKEVGDVLAEIDSLLSGSPDHATCAYAKTLADNINNGIGIVPCDSLWSHVPARAVEPPDSNTNTLVQGNRSAHTFQLYESSPSPFSTSARISYQLPEALPVKLAVYDVRGRLVRTLVTSTQSPGSYTVEWRGDNDFGGSAPAGAYLYRLDAGPYSATRKTTLIR
ncbi:MAG: FlgD immunoglobulin-like domain containing protein, partial [bacterium]